MKLTTFFFLSTLGFSSALAGCGSAREEQAGVAQDDLRAQRCQHVEDCSGNAGLSLCQDDVADDTCAYTCTFASLSSTYGTCKKNRAFGAPTCSTTDDCNAAFEAGTWKIKSSVVDTCVQNHDFPYVCMACTANRCTFTPGF